MLLVATTLVVLVDALGRFFSDRIEDSYQFRSIALGHLNVTRVFATPGENKVVCSFCGAPV